MADRLAIYRSALMYLGNAAGLSSLTEVSPTRNALDAVWQPAVDYMLAKGLWNFSIRSAQLSEDEDVEPLFGYQYAFSKPDDWVRTAAIANDATYVDGFEDYEDETNYWFANWDTLYIRYVSNDEAYGWNVGAWREPFAEALAAWLAFKCGLPLTSDKSNRNDLFTLFKSLLKEAKALDAVDERVHRRPMGRLVRARLTSGRRDDR
jgi:hypothetical protein